MGNIPELTQEQQLDLIEDLVDNDCPNVLAAISRVLTIEKNTLQFELDAANGKLALIRVLCDKGAGNNKLHPAYRMAVTRVLRILDGGST